MYVRDAKNRDEVWLLDRLEAMNLDDAAFRSRDYVIAVDEETDERVGFGRLRIHKVGGDDAAVCELSHIGVLEAWRAQGVGAHVVERLVHEASDADFDVVYSLTGEPGYLFQFGFDAVESSTLPDPLRDRFESERETSDDDVVAVRLSADSFEMPERLRERFKTATPRYEGHDEPEESAEDFGIDPDTATYKYDTGR